MAKNLKAKNRMFNTFRKLFSKFSLLSLPLLLIIQLMFVERAFGQDQNSFRVTGVITDATTGETIPNVNLRVKGEATGSISDVNGNYVIDVTSLQHTLLYSFVGYQTKEVNIEGRRVIDVALESEFLQLDELVVVGYGQRKKRDLTGSIVSLNSDDIENSLSTNPVSALQGRVAGVQITSNSGAPGSGISVNVRGHSSLNSGNSPLYVIDGVPIESSSLSSINLSENHGLNPLSDINPRDIESIEVLKDAASTAIYGSRAANGVVMITTKRGQSGKAQVDLNVSTGISQLVRKLSVLNATQYRELIIDSYQNMDTPVEPIWSVIDSLNPKNSGDVDWQEEMFRTARQHNVDLSVRGGSDHIRYAMSTSYLDQEGIILNSDYKKITSRLNVDYDATEKLTIGQSISFSHGINNRINAAGTGNTSVIRELLIRPPVYAMYLPDGSLNGYQFGRRNPIGLAQEATHINKNTRIIANEYLEYTFFDGLSFRSNLSLDFISMKEDQFIPSTLDYREGYNSGAVRATSNLTWANENYLSYTTLLGDAHNFGALAGSSVQMWNFERTGLDGMFFSSDKIRTLNAAGTISNQEVNVISEHSMLSYFGRLSYDYKSRYLLELSMRADGSSRFGADNRFGYFPSASMAWRFSDEAFLGNANFLNDGKFRLSVGRTGNEAIGNYVAQGEFAVGNNYLNYSGAAPTVMPNYALTWETTTQYNAGLDLSFFDSRILFNADVYLKQTEDLLYNVPLPRTTGFGFITQNIGKMENKGVEASLSTHNVRGVFNWRTNFNISLNRNEIVELPEELMTNGYIQNGSYHILKEGEPIGTFYGYKFEGVYARDEDNVNGITNGALGNEFKGGDPIWNDLNGDLIINEDDRQIIGNAEPDFFGGLTNDFSYKNFSLHVFFQFSYGNDIYSEINHQRNSVVRYNNLSTDALNRWRKQGDFTDFPKPVRDDPMRSDSRVQSRWVEDGSYLKLKTVNLKYRVPSSIIERMSVRSLEAYVSGVNLLTWTKYTGYDPDVSSYSGLRTGVDEGSYPHSRMIVFGLNIGF